MACVAYGDVFVCLHYAHGNRQHIQCMMCGGQPCMLGNCHSKYALEVYIVCMGTCVAVYTCTYMFILCIHIMCTRLYSMQYCLDSWNASDAFLSYTALYEGTSKPLL